MTDGLVTIIMGSEGDKEFSEKISNELKALEIPYQCRIASAHKHPAYLLNIMRDTEVSLGSEGYMVYITVAGMSNGLSGVVAANTAYPVIACPPYSEKFGGGDVYSSLRMPSEVPAMTVLEPKNAALAAAKIFAVRDPKLRSVLDARIKATKAKIEEADQKLNPPLIKS